MQQKSILIADYYAIARCGLRDVLEQEAGFEIVGEAVNGLDAVVKAKLLQPDLVVMNDAMPRRSGVAAARRIKALWPSIRIFVLVSYSHKELMKGISDGIVDGVALHSDSEAQLLSCLRKALYGEGFVASDSFYPSEGSCFTRSALTMRERQVLRLLAEGLCTKEVAAELRLSTRTVENHRARMMRRLEIKSFAELLRYGFRQGLIHL